MPGSASPLFSVQGCSLFWLRESLLAAPVHCGRPSSLVSGSAGAHCEPGSASALRIGRPLRDNN
eukprot:15485774-Alexandrium_andersonii.AAC.1